MESIPTGFVYSLSTHETPIDLIIAAQALAVLAPRSALYSAYDWANADGGPSLLDALLRKMTFAGTKLLLDSGGYEAGRRGDLTWTETRFHSALANAKYDWAISFDVVPTHDESPLEYAERLIEQCRRDMLHSKAQVIPLVHCIQNARGLDVDLTCQSIAAVCDHLSPPQIAIPERELGDGLIDRCRATRHLIARLREANVLTKIHCLGTGNPRSIYALKLAGMNSFDGLEWCRTAIDARTANLHHFQQGDIFIRMAPDAIKASPLFNIISDENANYYMRTLIFNSISLDFHLTDLANDVRSKEKLLWLLEGDDEILRLLIG